jgi:hypothetical protein
MPKETQGGEFSLVYNVTGRAHPVGLTEEQHRMLQAYLAMITRQQPVKVVRTMEVQYNSIK